MTVAKERSYNLSLEKVFFKIGLGGDIGEEGDWQEGKRAVDTLASCNERGQFTWRDKGEEYSARVEEIWYSGSYDDPIVGEVKKEEFLTLEQYFAEGKPSVLSVRECVTLGKN